MELHTLEGLDIHKAFRKLMLSKKKADAYKVIEHFFEMYESGSDRDCLWFIVTLALSADNERIDSRERSNTLFFHDCLELLLVACKTLIKEDK